MAARWLEIAGAAASVCLLVGGRTLGPKLKPQE